MMDKISQSYLQKAWNLWAKALGPKQGASSKEADMIAIIRTTILLTYMITNLFIILNAWSNLTAPRSSYVPCNIVKRSP
jgi:hypothetical protein